MKKELTELRGVKVEYKDLLMNLGKMAKISPDGKEKIAELEKVNDEKSKEIQRHLKELDRLKKENAAYKIFCNTENMKLSSGTLEKLLATVDPNNQINLENVKLKQVKLRPKMEASVIRESGFIEEQKSVQENVDRFS